MITQQEFEDLRKHNKEFEENEFIQLGPHPIRWSRGIRSLITHDNFILDFARNSIKLTKYSYNKRHKGNIVLLRYCSDKPHTNPPEVGGEHFKGAHLHIYKEGYDAKIAYNPNIIGIDEKSSMQDVFHKVCDYFNVINLPMIQNDLF